MKAIIWTKYGPPEVLQLVELEKPVPKENEVLVRIYASTVTTGDCEVRRLALPFYIRLPLRLYLGYRRPRWNKIPGSELAGVVEAVGEGVQKFKPGDPVFGTTGLKFGAYAEYICLSEDACLALKPANLTYAEAAAIPFGCLDALHFLKKASIQKGQKVLIVGAGGSIGTAAVQIARYYGAEVTGVDSSGKLDTLRSIGATHVIDYTREDFTVNGQTYDVIFDTVGKSDFSRSIQSLNENGFYLLANPGPRDRQRASRVSARTSQKVVVQTADHAAEDLRFIRELVEAGFIKPVIDRRYPLEEMIEAHRYVETGQKKGNVVITMDK